MQAQPDYDQNLDRIAYFLNQILAATRFITIMAFLILLQTCGS